MKIVLTKEIIEKTIEQITGVKTIVLKINSKEFIYKSKNEILKNPISDFLELIFFKVYKRKIPFKFIVWNNKIEVRF